MYRFYNTLRVISFRRIILMQFCMGVKHGLSHEEDTV